MAPPPPEPRSWVNALLFAGTIITTMAAGAMQAGANPFSHPELLVKGIPFSATLLLILGVHECAHYLAARRWGVRATLPYFIPVPPPLFMIGTMGAFIKLRSPIPNRNALVDMGASGPLAGFVVAVVVSMVGLARSEVIRMPEAMEGGALLLGNSLLFSFLSNAVIGHIPEGYDVMLSPVAFAGWIGLFVTAINLLPIGQLDGGHVIYALFGSRHRLIGKLTVVALLPLGIFWQGWFVWAFLLLMVLGMKHPPPYDMYQPLDPRRRLIGYVAIGVFLVSFTPVPFRFG
ncbi:MAG: site-2 protease family protein [Candidatus Latescibacteria bacterium]|nr:site-2 protease family protein [Candidatus Latescibacterota bacterium]